MRIQRLFTIRRYYHAHLSIFQFIQSRNSLRDVSTKCTCHVACGLLKLLNGNIHLKNGRINKLSHHPKCFLRLSNEQLLALTQGSLNTQEIRKELARIQQFLN